MNGSSLKRKLADQPEDAAGSAEGTEGAGQQPGKAQELSGPLNAAQQQKKQRAPPQLEGGEEHGQQPAAQLVQHPRQQDGQQQHAPQAAGRHQQLEEQPAPQPGRAHEQAAASGPRAEQALGPQTVPVPEQAFRSQRQQQQQQQQQQQGPCLQPQQQQGRCLPPQQQLAQGLPLPPPHSAPWQQPAVWPAAAPAPGWVQQPAQLWEQQQAQQPLLPSWDPSMGPAWDPALQQWAAAAAVASAVVHAPQHAQQAQQQWPSSAAVVPSLQGLGWHQPQAAALQQAHPSMPQQSGLQQQQQPSVQQQGLPQPPQGQPQGQVQAQGQRQYTSRGHGQQGSKLQRDVPPGGPAEALLRLAVRICCQRLGLGEHDGKQLGKVLEELDRNWKSGTCSGHSVSVLLKELDRRGLVVAREETSGGKRICYFRNIAC